MPITRRQFELGIDPATEEWMGKLHDFLQEHKDEAYAIDELVAALEAQSVHSSSSRIENALEALVKLSALSIRDVEGKTYYAFQRTLQKGIWMPDVRA